MIKDLLAKILDFIIPCKCFSCGCLVKDNNLLCDKCFGELNFILQPICYKCGHPLSEQATGKKLRCASCLKKVRSPFRYSRSALYYDDVSKNLILPFKFMDKTEFSKLFVAMMKFAGKDIFDHNPDLIIPIPLHYFRLIKRRYNQSAILAKELSCHTGIDCDLTSLIRSKNTKPQVKFSGRQRITNVKNAFVVKDVSKIKGKSIVLVDDILTTGSTLKEAAIALKKAGAKSVDTITIARVC